MNRQVKFTSHEYDLTIFYIKTQRETIKRGKKGIHYYYFFKTN